jgi:hypothetical protein
MEMHRASLIYHPRQVPVKILPRQYSADSQPDDFIGELAVHYCCSFSEGSEIELHLFPIHSGLKLRGRVIWSYGSMRHHLIGVSFYDENEAFRMRMAEQACHIAAYRMRMLERGRQLTLEAAADEWIRLYSDGFPESLPVEC